MPKLVAEHLPSHKRRVPPELFDQRLRAMRRDRAIRQGRELFLHERAFADCLERIALVRRRFSSAVLIGCHDPEWTRRLADFADGIETLATLEDGMCPFSPGQFDLCLSIGELDTINDLPAALLAIRASLLPNALFIGAIAGGDMLPQLRSAMLAADQLQSAATPRVHPRIEPSALAGLLAAAAFDNPVVDVDRVKVSYRSLDLLVRDLRRMGATNILSQRSRRPLSRAQAAAARRSFASAGDGERAVETFEILHFAAWTAS